LDSTAAVSSNLRFFCASSSAEGPVGVGVMTVGMMVESASTMMGVDISVGVDSTIGVSVVVLLKDHEDSQLS
jgi:hypothetical protein